MLHLRVVCPQELAGRVVDTLTGRAGVVAISSGASSSDGRIVTADLARECAQQVLTDLDRLGVHDTGMVVLQGIDTALGELVDRAEQTAPGEGADALIWDELAGRTGEDSTLTWTFGAFMVLATLLASIGVVTDSSIAIVGAMIIGPEFGPLAGLAVGLMRRRFAIARRAVVALLVGFPVAIVVTALLSALARAGGLITPGDITGAHRETQFIYHPGWFSLITALVAGAAGMLSLTSSKSAALVGVFVSVTTIPAAGNAAVAGVLGQWDETWLSLAQLGINLVGIVASGVLTLEIMRRVARPRARAA